MTTTQLVILGVALLGLALTVLAIAVCHARSVLDEAEARVGVRRCRFGIAPDRTDRSRTHLSPVSIEREQDERTA